MKGAKDFMQDLGRKINIFTNLEKSRLFPEKTNLMLDVLMIQK